jgi:predicted nucleic acid-binding protein
VAGDLIYWDTCVWLAWLTKQGDPGHLAGLEQFAEQFESGKKTLITSALTRVEVLQCTLTEEQRDCYRLLFKRRNFQEIPITGVIIDLAHDIRNFYQQQKMKGGASAPTTPDAIHLATAIKFGASEFHTFDGGKKQGKKRGLTPLSGNVAGHNLLIRFPFIPQGILDFNKPPEEQKPT